MNNAPLTFVSLLSRMADAALGFARDVAGQLAKQAEQLRLVIGGKVPLADLYLQPFIGAHKCPYGDRPICAGDGVCEMSERICECVGDGYRIIEPGRLWVHWDGSSWKHYKLPMTEDRS
ncbi:hypothetical protein [uncultured Pleomorphomonas sp.]|uniref:hypothetical protein n=1 Tax=uncultured Pleomorphomonas sp. TaxID=442121 RepID=UPI00258AC2C0|nr:hypothetical protein [uncultured Pleomorphomonas sp.]